MFALHSQLPGMLTYIKCFFFYFELIRSFILIIHLDAIDPRRDLNLI